MHWNKNKTRSAEAYTVGEKPIIIIVAGANITKNSEALNLLQFKSKTNR